MNGIRTLLLERVESLLPRTSAAACVAASPWCSEVVYAGGGYSCRHCHVSCDGHKAICSKWHHCKC
jgi:hypothetical protein